MNRDWDRTVLVLANDIESAHTLVLKDGELALQQGRQGEPDLTVISDSDTLTAVFWRYHPHRTIPQRYVKN